MVRGLALTASLLALSASAQVRPTPNAPLVAGVAVENAVYNSANHTVDYDMVNLSGKSVNAWVIVQYFRGADGSESVGGWGMSEMAGSLPSKVAISTAGAPAFGMLSAGERRHGQSVAKSGNRAGEISDMRVSLAAVIYDDASAEGDDAFLNFLFAARKARSDEQQRWIGRISALKGSANPAADAQQLYLEMVEASYQEDKVNVGLPPTTKLANGEVTADQRQGRQERQALQETVRGFVQATQSKRPLDPMISRMEAQADALLQSSVRKN